MQIISSLWRMLREFISRIQKLCEGFTLVELIVGVVLLTVVVGLVLVFINPNVYFRQARDSQRISDITTLRIAIAQALEDQRKPTLGSANIVYVSLLASNSDCSDLNLPVLSGGYQYRCSTHLYDIQKKDGTGWLPVDLSGVTNANLTSLPLDPLNDAGENTYYMYMTDGTKGWLLTAMMESRKSLRTTQNDGGGDPDRLEQGSDLSLWKTPYTMISYWPMDEGSGTTLVDERRLNNGSFVNSPTWKSAEECMRDGCLSFNGTNSYITVPHTSSLNVDDNFSVAFWARSLENKAYSLVTKTNLYFATTTNGWHVSAANDNPDTYFELQDVTQRRFRQFVSGRVYGWHHFVATKKGNDMYTYLDGEFVSYNNTISNAITNSLNLSIGCFNNSTQYCFNGYMDDLRLYDRTLSEAEVKAIYRVME